MRILGIGVLIAICAVLIILAGATVGLIATRDQSPHTSTAGASISPTTPPLNAATPWDQRQQPATHTNTSEQETSSRETADAPELEAETVRDLSATDQTVDENAASTAGNSALVNGPIDDNITKPAQHSSEAEPATRPEPDSDDQISLIPEKAQLKYPNLGSRLNDMVLRVEESAAAAQEAADSSSVQQDGSIAVTVYLSGYVANVAGFLENNGGDPRNVGEDYIEAYVPVKLLGKLSEQPGVLRVREIIPPQTEQ